MPQTSTGIAQGSLHGYTMRGKKKKKLYFIAGLFKLVAARKMLFFFMSIIELFK